jgi:sugar-specific transcriptional regulator TrmB
MKYMPTFCTPINQQAVLNKVITLVSSAKTEIIVTHSTHDDSPVKPNDRYYEAIVSAQKKGITITRYIFGRKDFAHKDTFGITQIYGGKAENYQRAVIVDEKKAMFKLGNHFYFTTYQPLCAALKHYITTKRY